MTTAGKVTPATGPRQGRVSLRLPDGTRSVQSPWVWRGFLFMALIALGLCLTFAMGGLVLYTVAWAVIAVGWFGIAMWLWRKHVKEDDRAWQARQPGGRAT